MIYKLKGTLASSFFVVMVLLVLSLIVLYPIMSMILLGAIFAYGVRPLSSRIDPKFRFHSLSITLAMIIIITPLIVLLAIILNTLIQSAPTLINMAQNWDLSLISSSSSNYLNSSWDIINMQLADIIGSIISYILKFLESLPLVALQIFIFVASTFYFARDGDKLWEYIKFTIPADRKGFFDNLFQEIERVMKSIIYGHFVTAIITGTMAGVGFYLLGYPYALFLGVLTGFFQLIPFIGHWPIPIILAAIDIISGNYIRAILVLGLSAFMSVVDIYLRPALSGKYADVHPLIFLLGFLSGPLIFGLVGFILGPLILGVAYAAVVAYKNDQEALDAKN